MKCARFEGVPLKIEVETVTHFNMMAIYIPKTSQQLTYKIAHTILIFNLANLVSVRL